MEEVTNIDNFTQTLCSVFVLVSPDIIRQVKSRRMRWAGHVARMGEERKVYKVLVGKPQEKRPLGRPRRRWEDGIRMDFKKVRLQVFTAERTEVSAFWDIPQCSLI
jgi:hypothetical protein